MQHLDPPARRIVVGAVAGGIELHVSEPDEVAAKALKSLRTKVRKLATDLGYPL